MKSKIFSLILLGFLLIRSFMTFFKPQLPVWAVLVNGVGFILLSYLVYAHLTYFFQQEKDENMK